jgi:hypothetical protein
MQAIYVCLRYRSEAYPFSRNIVALVIQLKGERDNSRFKDLEQLEIVSQADSDPIKHFIPLGEYENNCGSLHGPEL